MESPIIGRFVLSGNHGLIMPRNGATVSLPTHCTEVRSTQAVDAASTLGLVVPNKKTDVRYATMKPTQAQ